MECLSSWVWTFLLSLSCIALTENSINCEGKWFSFNQTSRNFVFESSAQFVIFRLFLSDFVPLLFFLSTLACFTANRNSLVKVLNSESFQFRLTFIFWCQLCFSSLLARQNEHQFFWARGKVSSHQAVAEKNYRRSVMFFIWCLVVLFHKN